MTMNRSTVWDKRHIFHCDNHSGRCKSIRNHLFQSPLCLKQFCLILWTHKLRSTFCIDVSRSTSVGCNLERKLQPTAFSFKIAVRRSTSEYSERERSLSLSLSQSVSAACYFYFNIRPDLRGASSLFRSWYLPWLMSGGTPVAEFERLD